MKILGIETSCDETAISLLEINGQKIKIFKDLVSSQIKIHSRYGGIVPEVAAREHVKTIVRLLEQAKIFQKDFDIIAVTRGPGLVTSLLVGVETAKVLSYLWNKPLLGVNHIEAHVWSGLLGKNKIPKVKFPALSLIVSGGHTQLILIKNYGQYKIIGETLDDAVGEAFDKVAKMLGLGYPGGPEIAKYAKKGDEQAVDLPRPMINSKDFNFSFSGLKTSVLYKVKGIKLRERMLFDMCASFQAVAADVLVKKTIRAAKKYQIKTILLGGGVSANQNLRSSLQKEIKKLDKIEFKIPQIKYTGDNATMVALAGYFNYQRVKNKKELKDNWRKLTVDPNLEI